MRELGERIDFWKLTNVTQYKWPKDFVPVDCGDVLEHVTDLQKLFCLLISKNEFHKSEIAKKFVTVGVRWLGFFVLYYMYV